MSGMPGLSRAPVSIAGTCVGRFGRACVADPALWLSDLGTAREASA